MREKTVFQGAATALITPLNQEGVDYPALKRLIDWQIEEQIDALVICGTTGEGATLSDAEHRKVLEFSLEAAAGRVPMIAGTGSNDTAYACQLTRHACQIGYDGVLVVTPYYNKATQNGLVAMYSAIADASTKPIIMYNVPSRTGVNIEPATYQKLADHPNIGGIKEANGNISKIVETMALVGDKLDLYSGNDDQIVPIMACGGKGVISVLSNVAPRATAQMCRKYLQGDVEGAMQMQKQYLPLINALFSEVNPIPAKAAMAAMGFCENYLRLPLTQMEPAHWAVLQQCMRDVGLDV
jgi:4-hydroxy-tetrahydrodipicolinate synthase